LVADGQQAGAVAVGEEAEVADAYEAAREQMQEETPSELIDGQLHQLLLVAMSRIAPAESHVSIFQSNESVVGDGDAVGVGAEISQGVLGSSEGTFGVDHPVLSEQSSQPRCKGARFGQMPQTSVELKCASLEGVLEPGDELAAEHSTEHLDRKEEAA